MLSFFSHLDCSIDIFFVEALLNLIFGVIDVVWICYAELVMVGMYGILWGHKSAGLPFPLACLLGIAIVAVAGVILHLLIIRPVLDQPPINQLLATGGVLFFLQASATMAFGIEFQSVGVRLGSLNVGDMSFSWSRLAAFGISILTMLALWLFLSRTYMGTAIRAIAQDRQIMPLMGVDARKIYLATSAIGGGLAGLAASLMVLQYDIYPQIGLQFGPLIFMICVLGGLGNMVGGFIAAFIISQFITIGGSCFATEWGYAVAFLFFMIAIFIRPQGLFGGKS
jgi:branched-chain amino acid transport system permease protein